MIRIEYNKETHLMSVNLQGESDILLTEFKYITEKILESFQVYNQELLVLEAITDVISEFAEEHTPKSKRR